MSRTTQTARPVNAARPLRRALSTPLMGAPGFATSKKLPVKSKAKVPIAEEDTMPERWMCVVVRREKITQAVGRIVQVQKRA